MWSPSRRRGPPHCGRARAASCAISTRGRCSGSGTAAWPRRCRGDRGRDLYDASDDLRRRGDDGGAGLDGALLDGQPCGAADLRRADEQRGIAKLRRVALARRSGEAGSMSPQPASYPRHRFPAEIISHAVWLYHVFSLSLRDVERILAELSVQGCRAMLRNRVAIGAGKLDQAALPAAAPETPLGALDVASA